jgi:hypothetical protein
MNKDKLSAASLKRNTPRRLSDGGGLYLCIPSKDAKSWVSAIGLPDTSAKRKAAVA